MVSRSSILLGPILTPRALRAFAASVFVCALAMPWLAWWMGAFGEAREVVEPERVVEYRPAMVALREILDGEHGERAKRGQVGVPHYIRKTPTKERISRRETA